LPSGGLDIAVSIHEPRQSSATGIILCPGFLDSRRYEHMVSLADGFAGAGCVAARLDTGGIWDSSGDESYYSISRYLRDIATVEAYLRKQCGVTSLLIGGHSMGGFVSLVYGASADVRGVIALCPPKQMLSTSVPDWQKKGIRISDRDLPDGSGNRTYRVPWAFAVDSSQYSALEAVKQYDDLPLYLMAAGHDAVVPPDEVMALYAAAHEPKRMVVFDDMPHDIRKDAQHSAIVTASVIDWSRAQELLPADGYGTIAVA
jgi:alpha-beta hydrolase superfamily lysophospholipase